MDIPIEGTGFTIHLDETQEDADKVIELLTAPRFKETMREALRLRNIGCSFDLSWVEDFVNLGETDGSVP
jgi:hypothetical protein